MMQLPQQMAAVLFDLDGVVIDSNTEIRKFWQQWAEKEKVPFDELIIKKYVLGRTTVETVASVFPLVDDQTRQAILASARDFDVAMRPALLEGLLPFLLQLRDLGLPTSLVTSSPIERVHKLLSAHNVLSFFNPIVTGDDITFGKPHPEPYLKMATLLNLDPRRCLVFEDSDSGIQSALAAGMSVIAVGNNNFKEVVGVIDNYSQFISSL